MSGDDYPIYGTIPETSFLCDGLVDGGYYADPEAQCQVTEKICSRKHILFYIISILSNEIQG
jgi:hypothetical protein